MSIARIACLPLLVVACTRGVDTPPTPVLSLDVPLARKTAPPNAADGAAAADALPARVLAPVQAEAPLPGADREALLAELHQVAEVLERHAADPLAASIALEQRLRAESARIRAGADDMRRFLDAYEPTRRSLDAVMLRIEKALQNERFADDERFKENLQALVALVSRLDERLAERWTADAYPLLIVARIMEGLVDIVEKHSGDPTEGTRQALAYIEAERPRAQRAMARLQGKLGPPPLPPNPEVVAEAGKRVQAAAQRFVEVVTRNGYGNVTELVQAYASLFMAPPEEPAPNDRVLAPLGAPAEMPPREPVAPPAPPAPPTKRQEQPE